MYGFIYVEIASVKQKQIVKEQIQRQKIRNRRIAFRYELCDLGIRTKKPERTEEEIKKVTEMVKNKDYNHPEIGILKETDLQRMKVHKIFN